VVGEAADGAQAVELARALRPDVVIMDIRLPGMNGIQATEEIKRLCPTTSVLILTAYEDDQYVFALLAAGAAGYLLKDVPVSELVRACAPCRPGSPSSTPRWPGGCWPASANGPGKGGPSPI